MTRYTLSILDSDYAAIRAHLFDANPEGNERAAYIFCNVCSTPTEERLLAAAWAPVSDKHIDWSSPVGMQIDAASYRAAMKIADTKRQRLVFVHSHPDSLPHHSEQDDSEERELFREVHVRVHNAGPHGSVVFTPEGRASGRVWNAECEQKPLEMIRVLGQQYSFIRGNADADPLPEFFERQIRAFGPDIQRLLKHLHLGVVGAGGTGSSVVEQLVRLGVGKITIADGDRFDEANVNRVYGSSTRDRDMPKVEIAQRNANHVAIGASIEPRDCSILREGVFKDLRNCDLIFCCVDKELPRFLLNRMSIYYLIPVIDVGVEIDSDKGAIQSVTGRITTLFPGSACLFCRGRVSSDVIQAEAIEYSNPEEAARLRGLGYARELAVPDPAVICFTTTVAALGVSEMLHRFTGYGGSDRISNEVVVYFHDTRMRTTARVPMSNCFCADRSLWGRGDRSTFLDTVWVN